MDAKKKLKKKEAELRLTSPWPLQAVFSDISHVLSVVVEAGEAEVFVTVFRDRVGVGDFEESPGLEGNQVGIATLAIVTFVH